MNHIRGLAAQGYSIRRIAEETGIARNTIRKYLRGSPEPVPRRRRTSKLDHGGASSVLLTDRMKSVLLTMEDGVPQWNARFADFAASTGFTTRVWLPTEGKPRVGRS
ncbi:MAG TPA: helix-turn-helix domain-containing protein [Rhodothermales bacterium]|nr:helix-turn-helix domain-containing protein [Rhodothermales bacterium]